jgi:predicted RNA polymerase sigma factor
LLPERPDWAQILTLYEALCVYEPTPVVRLNLAVAMAETGRLLEAITLVQGLESVLQDYQPFHAVLADLARRLGQSELSLNAYDQAIRLATRPEDAAFLRKRRAELSNPSRS